MTTRRTRDLKRKLMALAAIGATVAIEPTGRTHFRAVFNRGAARVVCFFANTPSDFRTEQNETAYARRKLRTIDGRAGTGTRACGYEKSTQTTRTDWRYA
jgi:hypothetical protein